MATVNGVQQSLELFRKAFDEHVIEDQQVYRNTQAIQTILNERTDTINNIQSHVKNVDERVSAYEKQYKEMRVLLHKINAGVNLLKWIGITVGGAIIVNTFNYIWHLIHP